MTGSSTTPADLARYVSNWQPDPVEATDVLVPQRARELAATLDLADEMTPGEPLPPLWQWVYFLDWPPTADLGADGHPRDGHFLPPIPDRRRMFAGGRMTVNSPLVLGEHAARRSAVIAKTVKHGRTGAMLFVTVRHEYSQNGQIQLLEEQDLVYRSDSGSTTPFSRPTEPLAAQSTPWAAHPITHPALLFRFSALTGNAHRIHYDEPYTTTVEGFPGLVVHGPLLAIFMTELARTNSAGRAISELECRLLRPVFVGDQIRVQGTPAADGGSAELNVVSGNGTSHASARVTYN
jgi:3-methylfumaryl-CoA hydratase